MTGHREPGSSAQCSGPARGCRWLPASAHALPCGGGLEAGHGGTSSPRSEQEPVGRRLQLRAHRSVQGLQRDPREMGLMAMAGDSPIPRLSPALLRHLLTQHGSRSWVWLLPELSGGGKPLHPRAESSRPLAAVLALPAPGNQRGCYGHLWYTQAARLISAGAGTGSVQAPGRTLQSRAAALCSPPASSGGAGPQAGGVQSEVPLVIL